MEYPECEKLKSVSKESNSCGAFVDWCVHKRYISKLRRFPGMEKALAEYFEIDLNEVERERQDILIRIQKGE